MLDENQQDCKSKMPSTVSEESDPGTSEVDTLEAMSSLEHESESLWKHHRPLAIATLTLPIWLSLTILLGAFVVGGMSLTRKLVVAVIASALAGRFIIWGGESAEAPVGFSALQLAMLVLYLDTIWAVVLTWHAGFLFHVPWIGTRLKAAVQEGSQMLNRNRWMRRLTVGAVLMFVMCPISSTGSIGGSLLGRLLGLSQVATFLTVLIGSILGCALMFAGAEVLSPWFQDVGPAAQYGSISLVVLILFVLSQRYRRSIAE